MPLKKAARLFFNTVRKYKKIRAGCLFIIFGLMLASCATVNQVPLSKDAAQSRLIDTRTKSVLAEEIFAYLTDEDSSVAPTYDDLLNNNAERLKNKMRKLADEAILHFRQKGLNI